MALSASPPAADVAVARKLLEDNATVIAVAPADPKVATWPVLLRLATAIKFLGHQHLGLVRGPDPEAPPRQSEGREGPGEAFRIVDIDPQGEIAELVLPPAVGLGEAAMHLERALIRSAGLFSHILVAFDRYIPDVREALELPDAFVSAVRAGQTRETDLLALVRLLPASRHLGTLLID
jgi:hypothetical protein